MIFQMINKNRISYCTYINIQKIYKMFIYYGFLKIFIIVINTETVLEQLFEMNIAFFSIQNDFQHQIHINIYFLYCNIVINELI